MTTKTLFIDLRTRGGQRTKTDLVGVGQSGQRALQRIAGAAQPASAGLLAVSRASAATRGALRSLSGQVGGLIAAYAGLSGLRRSVQLFADFDEGLIAVAKTTDLSRDEVREFGRSITDLSKRIPVAAKELLDIGATAGQLGVSGSRDLLRFTDTVAKLGRASNLAGEEAATSLARMLNVTGENIGEVGRLASVIVRLGNNMAVTEREIARMATEVSLATTNFRVGTTAASAIGAAMASVGIRAELGGSAVGRAFRTINSAVLSGGGQLEKLSRIAGVTGDELVRVFKQDSVAAFNLFLKGLARIQAQGADVAVELKAIGLGGEEINKVLPVLASRFDLLTFPGSICVSVDLGFTPSYQASRSATAGPDPAPKLRRHGPVLLTIDFPPERRTLQRSRTEIEREGNGRRLFRSPRRSAVRERPYAGGCGRPSATRVFGTARRPRNGTA